MGKINRVKKSKKLLSFYKQVFTIIPPYKVIVDADFIQTAIINRVQIEPQIASLLLYEFKIYVTGCILKTIESLGEKFLPALNVARGFAKFTCGHGSMLNSKECLKRIIGDKNPNRLIITGQHIKFRNEVAETTPGVPMIFLQGKVPVFVHTSKASLNYHKDKEIEKIVPSMEEKQLTKTVLKEEKLEKSAGVKEIAAHLKRKKPSAPNPLSCKKTTKVAPKLDAPVIPEVKSNLNSEPLIKKKKRVRRKNNAN